MTLVEFLIAVFHFFFQFIYFLHYTFYRYIWKVLVYRVVYHYFDTFNGYYIFCFSIFLILVIMHCFIFKSSQSRIYYNEKLIIKNQTLKEKIIYYILLKKYQSKKYYNKR